MPQDVQRNNNLSISNLPSVPDYAEPVKILPDYAESVNEKPKESSLLERAWVTANKPLLSIMTPEMRAAGASLAQPSLNDSIPSAMLKGFMSGGTEGLADLISSQSAPLNLGLEATGAASVSPGLSKISSLLELPGKVATAGMVGHGLYGAATEPTISGKIGGLSEAAIGGAGFAKLNKKVPSYAEPVKTQKLLGPGVYEMPPSSLEGVINEHGQKIAPEQPKIIERPEGPWSANISTEGKRKSLEDFQYNLAREKFNMGHDLPKPRPLIKDYWIEENGKKILNPKYQNLGKTKERIDITEGFGGSGHPESPEYVGKVLKAAGTGKPGLSVELVSGIAGKVPDLNATRVIYRDSSGNPIVVAKVAQDFNGRKMVIDLAADKSRGLLTGRAVKAVGDKLKELGATEAAGTTSPDARNFINKMQAKNPTATFKGWQEGFGDIPDSALYDIKGGPSNNSTVTEAGLKKLGIDVPETPPNDLKKRKIEKPTLANLVSGETGAIRFGSNKEAPIRPHTKVTREPQPEVVNKLIEALKLAGPKRESQESLYSMERAKRIVNAESVKETGLPGFYKQLHELKGELPKVDFERTKLSQSDVNDLINYVTNSKKLLPYEKINAKMGLLKLLSAKREELPQRNELKLLGEVFGDSFNQIIEMHGGLGGGVSKKVLLEVANAPKAIMASIDTSAPLRQGLPLIHRSEFWNSLKPMMQSLVSQKNYEALQESILDRPGYLEGKKFGLHLTDLNNSREEAYGSNIANLVPGVKASERAYVSFLNKLRADTFDSLLVNAKDQGLDVEKVGHEITNYVNVATGRGSLGRLDKVAQELNTVFFSPRLIASRLTLLNPNYYIKADPFVRKEALKSLLAIAGSGLMIDGLAKAFGASIGTNPLSSDFGKTKFGNTRLDPYGGFQQYIVAASRLITNEETSSTTDKTIELGKKFGSPTRKDVLLNFAENKLSPVASLIDVLLKGKDFSGKPVQISKEIRDRFTPLLINDLIDVYKDDPNHLPLGIGAALGMGMQTYAPQMRKSIGMRIRP